MLIISTVGLIDSVKQTLRARAVGELELSPTGINIVETLTTLIFFSYHLHENPSTYERP